jgi:hypothetical protein
MTTPSPNFGCTTARPASVSMSVSMSPAGASTSSAVPSSQLSQCPQACGCCSPK